MSQVVSLRRRSPVQRRARPLRAKSVRIIHERNCSVGRTVTILSDSWAFLVLRKAILPLRVSRTFQSALGIPRATLTAAIAHAHHAGPAPARAIFGAPQRFEYRLHGDGMDLYPVMMALLAFGDKWLKKTTKPPIYLVHNLCGQVCRPMVACSQCKEEVNVKKPLTTAMVPALASRPSLTLSATDGLPIRPYSTVAGRVRLPRR